MIISWSDNVEGIGHVNCYNLTDWHDLVHKLLPFKIDNELTDEIRKAASFDYIQASVTAFRRIAPTGLLGGKEEL